MKNATEIVIVLDRSGSMGGLVEDTIGTFNGFLAEQKALPGEANMTLVLFNTAYSIEYLSKPIQDVAPLDTKTYVTLGFTALLDAVGNAVDSLGETLAKQPEESRPDKVLVVIVTDGLENASKEYTLEQVRHRIAHQQERYKWQFLFLGANVDAFAEARNLGISRRYAARYTASKAGTRSVGKAASRGATEYRSNGEVSMDWNKDVK